MCRSIAINRLRIDESRDHFSRLKTQFDKWFEVVLNLPFGSLINTPLSSLQTVLGSTIESIDTECKAIDKAAKKGDATDKGTVYEQCRQIDHKTIWTRRVWECYRDKIDQRQLGSHARIVEAADEVAWSCFLPAFEANEKNQDVVRCATPLPYVETFYTPRAFMVDVPPDELESREDQSFFQECLATMPIPLIGVPTECLHTPWFLVTLSHEIGHQVQHLILPKKRLVREFANVVDTAVREVADKKQLQNGSAADRWRDWSQEMFADLYAVTQLGEAAAWSIHEYIWTDSKGIWKTPSSGEYPSPGVRQAILKHACDFLQIEADTAYGNWRNETLVPQGPEAVMDLDLVKEVVAQVLAANPAGCASLEAIAKRSLPSIDNVKTFSQQLVGELGAYPNTGEAVTREVMSGGVRAAANLVDATQPLDPATRRKYLAANLPAAITRTRKSTLRAEEPEIGTEEATKAFWALLQSER